MPLSQRAQCQPDIIWPNQRYPYLQHMSHVYAKRYGYLPPTCWLV